MKRGSMMEGYLDFIKEAEGLKSTHRTAWTASGDRESTAEHSWRLALFAAVLCREFPELDRDKVMFMCLVHDLGEIYSGDISAALMPDADKKHEQEQQDVARAVSGLPGPCGEEIQNLCREYNEGTTPEARFVKALDKAETIIQHVQGKNPGDFDYKFNLTYGREYFRQDQRLKLLREIIDRDTQKRMDMR